MFFINGLGNGVECTLSKFTDNTKVGTLADSPEDHIAIQRDLNRMEWWQTGTSCSSTRSTESYSWGGAASCWKTAL